MLAVTFSYPDVDFEHTFSLLRPIHGIRYNNSRPIKAVVYGTTEDMDAYTTDMITERVIKTYSYALHPVKGVMEVPRDIARCLGIEESEQIVITNNKVDEQDG